MKRIFILLLIIITSQVVRAQKIPQFVTGPGTIGIVRDQLRIDSLLFMPRRTDTTFAPGAAGAVIYRTADNRLYIYNGTYWSGLFVSSVATNNGSGITGGTITSSGTIAADTTNVLSTKAYRQKGIDSLAALISAVKTIYNADGTLSGNRTVGVDDKDLNLSATTGNVNLSTNATVISLNGVNNTVDILSDGGGAKRILLNPTSPGINITDVHDELGLIYNADYSINGLAENRWIPDIAAVRKTVHDSSGNYIHPSDTAAMLTNYLRTLSNQGSGIGIFKQKTGHDAELKSLTTGYGITQTNNTNDINTKLDTATVFPAIRTTVPTYYNSNIGSFYRLAVPNTDNIKTLAPGYGILNDSTTNTNAITQKADTATLFPAVRATIPSSSPTLTSTYVGYGSGSNLLTGTSPFNYNASIKQLSLDSNTFNKNFYTMLGDPSLGLPTLVQFRRMFNGSKIFTGAIGAGGSTEINMFNNLDYRDNTHKYYDTTLPAIWSYLGYTNGFGLQYTAPNHRNNDSMWSYWGREIFKVEIVTDGTLPVGEAITGGSRVNTQWLRLYDGLKANEGNQLNARFYQKQFTWDGSGSVDMYVYQNTDNSSQSNLFRYLKNKSGNYNIGSGTKIWEMDANSVAQFGCAATANVIAGFSNAEFYWKTFNSAGVSGERMRLTENGKLGIGTTIPSQMLHVVGQVQIDTITTGTLGTDSILVSQNGLIKKVLGTGLTAGYTFSTGFTNTSGTITNNLSTGVSGGQTLIGSTSTTSGLTYKTTTGVGTTGADHIFVVGNNGATEAMRINNAARVGIGVNSSTGWLSIQAGTTSVAPIVLNPGTNLSGVQDGAIEYNGTNYFASVSTTRYTLAKTLTNTATLDFGNTLAGTVSDLTVTVTGAVDGDAVTIGVPNGSYPAMGTFTAWVSATNTVTIRFANNSLTLAQDPASGTFRVSVLKY